MSFFLKLEFDLIYYKKYLPPLVSQCLEDKTQYKTMPGMSWQTETEEKNRNEFKKLLLSTIFNEKEGKSLNCHAPETEFKNIDFLP